MLLGCRFECHEETFTSLSEIYRFLFRYLSITVSPCRTARYYIMLWRQKNLHIYLRVQALGRCTCLVLESISCNDSIGFCWHVPVDINTVQMSLLDPEGFGSRWCCREKHSRKTTHICFRNTLGICLCFVENMQRDFSYFLQVSRSVCYYWAALRIDCLPPLYTSYSCCRGRAQWGLQKALDHCLEML